MQSKNTTTMKSAKVLKNKENTLKQLKKKLMNNQETLLIKQGFELSHQDNSRKHYCKDLGGDGYTILHIFLKPDGSFSGELQEFLYEDDGSQYDQITKEPVEENESLQEFLNRI